jgi:uncharacterized protein (TIGR03546 family)
MTLLLKQLFNLFKLLNSDKGENQLAAGVACGLILGFAPGFSLQTVLIIVVLFFARIQIGAALSCGFFFSIIAWVLDPVFDQVGQVALEMESFKGLYTTMYNLPIVPFTKFYNSVAMGALIISVIAFPIVFFISKMMIVKYRNTVIKKFEQTKFFKALKATSFYKWYVKYEELYG